MIFHDFKLFIFVINIYTCINLHVIKNEESKHLSILQNNYHQYLNYKSLISPYLNHHIMYTGFFFLVYPL